MVDTEGFGMEPPQPKKSKAVTTPVTEAGPSRVLRQSMKKVTSKKGKGKQALADADRDVPMATGPREKAAKVTGDDELIEYSDEEVAGNSGTGQK